MPKGVNLMKRLLLACLAVAFLAACQDGPLPTEAPEAPLFKKAKNTPQAQINSLLKQIFPKPWSPWHDLKSQLFDAVGDKDYDAAIAPATALINGARAQTGVSDAKQQKFADVITAFAQLPAVDLSGLGPNTGLGFVTPTMGGVITSDPSLGGDLGFAVATFLVGDAPENLAVIVESPQDFAGSCHPSGDVGAQVPGCSPMSTVPAVTEFVNEIVIAVCLDFDDPDAIDATLHRSNGATVELVPAASPPELVEDCDQTFSSESSNWLMNFASAGWTNVGRPLVSLFSPEPLRAAVFTAGTSGSLGGRTKKFSNFGWAVPLEEGEPDLLIDGISTDPNSPGGGDALDVTVTVENDGDAAADGFEVYFELEFCDDGCYGNIVFSGTVSVGGLAAGASTDVEFNVTCVDEGDYVLRAEADADFEVDESDETNNDFELDEFTVTSGDFCNGYD